MAITFLTVSALFISSVILCHAASLEVPATETCGLTNQEGINTFTLHSSSPNGNIPFIHIQYDTSQKLPVTSTVLYDTMNLVQNVERVDNFRMINCNSLNDKQQNCANTLRLSMDQRRTVGNDSEYNSWDRGHLTPVNPMRFSADAVSATFFCVNIAPQEPWTNRCPWYAVEERTLSRAKTHSSYVMTGLCSGDNPIDGQTYYKLNVPNCFWKMTCYIDPSTKETKVVSFISNNTLIPALKIDEGQKERKESTVLPRSQQDVLNKMGSNANLITSAWAAAEEILTEGRYQTELPTAESCANARDISDETVAEWKAFMKLHKPPFGCK